jgi:uncharacterized protein with PhoU and TrkA domain
MEGFEGEEDLGAVEYEPVSVKELLVEMKDTAELLIDLSYSAVLDRNEELAREVLRLEGRMDVLELRARMSLLMAARKPADAEQLAPVLGIVAATGDISDAAGDIAKIVLEEIGLPEPMRAAIPEAVETLQRGVLDGVSAYGGRTLGAIDLESETGVRVLALRRGDQWVLNPGPETTLEAGDVVLLRGPESAIGDVLEELTQSEYEGLPESVPALDDLERAVDTIVHMKNVSELAVDLAYSSVLFDAVDLAEEVSHLEVEVDALQSRFEAWTLRAAAESDDPVALRGLIRFGHCTERISDAAIDISEGVLRGMEVHPVVRLAVEESDEIITRVVVEPGSRLDGTVLVDGVPDEGAKMSVLAIRRPDDGWVLVADTTVTIHPGDVLIAKGTRTAASSFSADATT